MASFACNKGCAAAAMTAAVDLVMKCCSSLESAYYAWCDPVCSIPGSTVTELQHAPLNTVFTANKVRSSCALHNSTVQDLGCCARVPFK
jgi:hypothetical protein